MTELPEWVHVSENEDGFKVNQYFLDHPKMVLGTPTAESTQYGRQDYTVAPIEGANLAEQLHEAIQHIHGEYTEREIEQAEVPDIMPADPDVRNYSFTMIDGDVFYREGGIMVRQDVSATMSERIKGMMERRDCTRRLIELQTIDAGDWFYDYVEYVYENVLMDGTSDTTFEPNSNMTRAQCAAMLMRFVEL